MDNVNHELSVEGAPVFAEASAARATEEVAEERESVFPIEQFYEED